MYEVPPQVGAVLAENVANLAADDLFFFSDDEEGIRVSIFYDGLLFGNETLLLDNVSHVDKAIACNLDPDDGGDELVLLNRRYSVAGSQDTKEGAPLSMFGLDPNPARPRLERREIYFAERENHVLDITCLRRESGNDVLVALLRNEDGTGAIAHSPFPGTVQSIAIAPVRFAYYAPEDIFVVSHAGSDVIATLVHQTAVKQIAWGSMPVEGGPVAIDDFDGDGIPDLAIGNQGGGPGALDVSLLLVSNPVGAANVTALQLLDAEGVPLAVRGLELADIRLDTARDLLALTRRSDGDQKLRLLLNNAD